jgi:hypothetical protein
MGKELTDKDYEKTLSKGALEPADEVTETAPADFCDPDLVPNSWCALREFGGGKLTTLLLQSPEAINRYWEFFTANIRNRSRRTAYFVAGAHFSTWCVCKSSRWNRCNPCMLRHHRRPYGNALETHGDTIPGRDPHALRLARQQPG